MRLFSAIALPASVIEALEATQAALMPHVSFKRWQELHQAHLTLHFLGEVPDARLGAVEAALAASAQAHGPFELALEPLGTFGGAHRPQVLWAGVGGERDALVRLQADGQLALEAAGFALERRAYAPHITLARTATAALAPGVLEQAAPPPLRWRVAEVLLFRSETRPSGAVHSVIGRYGLDGERIARTTL